VLFAGSWMLMAAGLALSGESDARAIVDQSIKAVGGEAALAKHNTATWTETGTYYGMGEGGFPFTGKYFAQMPNKFRMEIEGVFTIVYNGDKGWMQGGGETKDMTKEQLAKQKLDQRAEWMAHLLPLKEKAFSLKALPEAKVGDQVTQVVKASRKDYPDLTLYFDAKTHLLAKVEWKTPSSEKNNAIANQEVYYHNYKELQGAKVPTKIVVKQDGKDYVEAELKDYRAVDKLDDKLFTMPQ
jgi:hypothetical protein